MSLVRARRRRTAARRPRARQGQGHQGRTLGDYHFEASPSTSVTRNSEATRPQAVDVIGHRDDIAAYCSLPRGASRDTTSRPTR